MGPLTTAVKLRHAFIKHAKSLIFNDHDQNRATVAFAFVQDHGKAAIGLRGAQQSGNFDMGRKARVHRAVSVQRRAQASVIAIKARQRDA